MLALIEFKLFDHAMICFHVYIVYLKKTSNSHLKNCVYNMTHLFTLIRLKYWKPCIHTKRPMIGKVVWFLSWYYVVQTCISSSSYQLKWSFKNVMLELYFFLEVSLLTFIALDYYTWLFYKIISNIWLNRLIFSYCELHLNLFIYLCWLLQNLIEHLV